jgi:hypothetical protein
MIGALSGFIGALHDLIPRGDKPVANVAGTQATALNKFIEMIQNLEIELLYYQNAKSTNTEVCRYDCILQCMLARALGSETAEVVALSRFRECSQDGAEKNTLRLIEESDFSLVYGFTFRQIRQASFSFLFETFWIETLLLVNVLWQDDTMVPPLWHCKISLLGGSNIPATANCRSIVGQVTSRLQQSRMICIHQSWHSILVLAKLEILRPSSAWITTHVERVCAVCCNCTNRVQCLRYHTAPK